MFNKHQFTVSSFFSLQHHAAADVNHFTVDIARAVRRQKRHALANVFRLYMYTALAPLPLASFAGESTQSVGISFIKSYVGVCLEGAVIVLACVIYAAFVSTPTVSGGEATTMVWSYLTEIIFNMLVLVGLIKGSDRIIHEMMGL